MHSFKTYWHSMEYLSYQSSLRCEEFWNWGCVWGLIPSHHPSKSAESTCRMPLVSLVSLICTVQTGSTRVYSFTFWGCNLSCWRALVSTNPTVHWFSNWYCVWKWLHWNWHCHQYEPCQTYYLTTIRAHRIQIGCWILLNLPFCIKHYTHLSKYSSLMRS